jgi:hypothetical protein
MRTRSLVPSSRLLRAIACWAAALLGAQHAAGAQVTAVVTADNAYMLGFGPASGPATWQAPVNNTVSGQIFSCAGGPEVYTLNPGVGDYLYIAANSDKAVTQGVLGRFALAGGQMVVSGVGPWQVLPTGHDVPLSAAAANTELATSTAGWANSVTSPALTGLVFGEPNVPTNVTPQNPDIFPVVCPGTAANSIPGTARWMWYRSRPNANPFNTNPGPGGHREFLIFRLPVRALMCTCPRVRTDQVFDAVDRAVDIRAVREDSARPRP